jgi:hypothetical protein
MIQDIQNHKGSYSVLALVAIIYLAATYNLRNNPMLIVYLTVGFGLFYFFWGVVHHQVSKTLSAKVMLEYFLVTALGIVIMSTLLL